MSINVIITLKTILTCKARLRKDAADHTTFAIFSKLIGLATYYPQRILLTERSAPTTLEHMEPPIGPSWTDANTKPKAPNTEEVTQAPTWHVTLKNRVLTHSDLFKTLWHATKKGCALARITPRKNMWHATSSDPNQTTPQLWHATSKVLISKTNRPQPNFIKFYVNKLDTLADIPIIMPIPLPLALPPPQGNIL